MRKQQTSTQLHIQLKLQFLVINNENETIKNACYIFLNEKMIYFFMLRVMHIHLI